MLKIGICDDKKMIVKALKEILEECMEEEGIQGEITAFYSGQELLTGYSGEEAVFLDIDMPGMDGIETGQNIRKRGYDCKIIMATKRGFGGGSENQNRWFLDRRLFQVD